MGTIDGYSLTELRSFRKSLMGTAGATQRRYQTAIRAIQRVEGALTRPLRVAILGEENSGKSLFINYLLKHQILPSSRFSGEDSEILIRYASEPSVYVVGRDGNRNRLTSKAFGALAKPEMRGRPITSNIIYHSSGSNVLSPQLSPREPPPSFGRRKTIKLPSKLIDVSLPLDILKEIEFIEVRGLPERKANTPAEKAFRKVDLTVWCTLATQAWKETEVASWNRIPIVHRQSSLMLVTYKEAIGNPGDEVKILDRLRRDAGMSFNDVILVSLKDAVASHLSPEAENSQALHIASNVDAVEAALLSLCQEAQARRLHKASHVLRRVAGLIARSNSTNRDVQDRELELAIRLDGIAQSILNSTPSVSLSVQAA